MTKNTCFKRKCCLTGLVYISVGFLAIIIGSKININSFGLEEVEPN